MKPRIVKTTHGDWVIVCGGAYCISTGSFETAAYLVANWSDLAYVLGAYLYEQRQEKAASRDAPRVKHGYN